MRLKDKRCIVTAAASGMGEAGVRLFAAEGARVVALDRDAAALRGLVEGRDDEQVKGFVVDLTDREATLSALRDAIENLDFGSYDVAANLNLTSAIVISGAVLPHMVARNAGSIIFTSSAAGLVGSALSPIYSAFKSGIVGLTKGLAVRYAARNVRVNALCPGPISTPMLHNDFMASDARFTPAENLERVISVVPMGRMGQAIEVAHAALWLASDESSFVTGIALPIDGGQTAR